jgi:hypothetical protein
MSDGVTDRPAVPAADQAGRPDVVWRGVAFLCMAATVTLAFAHSCSLREHWFGRLDVGRAGHHHWLTGSTLLFSRNWYREGANHLRWLMLETPKSPEFPTLADRNPYASYPPGTVVPVYLLALATGFEPTPALIMRYNLGNHLATALLVSIFVWCLFLRQGAAAWTAAVAGTVAGLIALFNAAAMYFQQNVFFSDQAIIVPFVAFVTLEVFGRDQPGWAGRALRGLQYAVLMYGIATDWLFIEVMAVTLLKRLATGELGGTAAERIKGVCVFCAGPALVVTAFIAQLYSVGKIQALIDRGWTRMGSGTRGKGQLDEIGGFYDRFWVQHFPTAFGPRIGVPLIQGSTAVFAAALLVVAWNSWVRKRPTDRRVRLLLSAGALLLLPCLIQVHLFQNHSAVHDFSVLKFSPVLAVVPFFLVPLLVQALIEAHFPIGRVVALIGHATVLTGMVLGGAYACYSYSRCTDVYFRRERTNFPGAASAVRAASRESDVVFSPEPEFDWTYEGPLPYPQLHALSMKYVYPAKSPREIEPTVKWIEQEYSILIVFANPPGKEWTDLLRGNPPVAFQAQPFFFLAFRVSPERLHAVVAADDRGG